MLRPSSPVRREPRSWMAARRLACPAVSAAVIAIAGFLVAPASAASTSGSLTLASQSAWIGVPGTFEIAVNVRSALPPSEIGLELELYPALSSRQAFAASTTGPPSQSCLDETPLLPIGGSGGSRTNQKVPISIPLTTSSSVPTCETPTSTFALNCRQPGPCNDVYPLSVALVDRSSGRTIRSFTTHIVVASLREGSTPLKVGLISQLGARPNLAPNGSPSLSQSVSSLTDSVKTLANNRDRLSVALYPDLLLALAGKGSGPKARLLSTSIDALVSHARPGARIETLTTPLANIDASALAANGLSGDVPSAISAGRSALAAHYGHEIEVGPYVSSAPMSAPGLAALQRACLNEFVVPEASIPALAGALRTPTAPLQIGKPAGCGTTRQPLAFVADTTLTAELASTSNDPVLAGENVLGDLAQVYFEGPFDLGPRAVVAIAGDSINPRLLQVVLSGLHGNPILSTSQVSNLFKTVPPGSNGNLVSATLGGPSSHDAPSRTAVAESRRAVLAVKKTMPNNSSLLRRLNYAVIASEASGLRDQRRQAYLDAPRAAISAIGRAITIVGSGEVTLTASRGKIPITIQSTVPGLGPVNVVVHLASSQLVLPDPTTTREQLTSKDTNETVVVSTRTSGSTDLEVVVYSATGGYELSRRSVTVRSTAVSGVAIALSAAALLVLLAWWVRSIVRTRRKKAMATRAVRT